jgi:hypothetical protein
MPQRRSGDALSQQPRDRELPRGGQFNSSITRVRPFFCHLLARDESGADWLPALLAASPNAELLPRDVRTRPGDLEAGLLKQRKILVSALDRVVSLERCFEYSVPPPTAFLRWLLEHPERLRWPTRGDGTPTSYGPRTQRWRQAFLSGDEHAAERAKSEGLKELALYGNGGSRRKRWAFEGFTEVDCLLATDRLVLFIEGKRNEPLSPSTDWFPARRQLVRNLEAAREYAGSRAAAVLLVAERPLAGELDGDAVAASLPHLKGKARAAVTRAYLGQTTWDSLCHALSVPRDILPKTKFEALAQLESLGRVAARET